MSHVQEIEKKYFLSAGEETHIEEKLQSLNARYIGEKWQKDTYFNVPGRDSYASKECLRIRESTEKIEVTYKPPTEETDNSLSHFAKKEVNLSIRDAETASILLRDIGCEVLAVVEKKRRDFVLDKINISVDNLEGVGWFVELECIEEAEHLSSILTAINELADNLGITEEMVEVRPYRDIVVEQARKGSQ